MKSDQGADTGESRVLSIIHEIDGIIIRSTPPPPPPLQHSDKGKEGRKERDGLLVKDTACLLGSIPWMARNKRNR